MAQARFLQVEYQLQDFLAYKIVSHPQYKLNKTIQRKFQLQMACERGYFDVLSFKALQVSIAALYRIGFMYHHSIQALTALKAPKELKNNPNALMMYKTMIEKVLNPLKEKAQSSVEHALQVARDHKINNKWSKRSKTLLSKIVSQTGKN